MKGFRLSLFGFVFALLSYIFFMSPIFVSILIFLAFYASSSYSSIMRMSILSNSSRILLLLLFTLGAYSIGRLDLIGDSYSLYWLYTDGIKSILSSNYNGNERLYYSLLGFIWDGFDIQGYGISFYFYLVSILKTAFWSINIDLKLLNAVITVLGVFFIYNLQCKISSENDARVVAILYLFYPTLTLWSCFLLKDSLQFSIAIVLYWIIVNFKKKMIVKILLFIFLLCVLGLNRSKMVPLYFTFFIVVLIYYHLQYKLLSITGILGLLMIHDPITIMIKQALYTLVRLNYGHFMSGGYSFILVDMEYIKLGIVPSDLNCFNLLIKGFYNVLFQPNPFYFYNFNYGLFQFMHVVWLFMVLMALVGLMYLIFTGKFNKGFQIIAMYIIFFGIIIGLGDGNIGTLIRHRSMIEPFVFIFSAVGLSVCFPLKRIWLKICSLSMRLNQV